MAGYSNGRDYIASAITDHKTKALKYVDSEQFYSCFGRFANDPLDDHLVNAKIVWNGSKMVLVAWKPIAPGDEIYISYHPDYWKGKLDKTLTCNEITGEGRQEGDVCSGKHCRCFS